MKVTAKKHEKGSAPKRKVSHIRIQFAGNGATVEHHLEPEPMKPGEMSLSRGNEPKPMVFNKKNAMLAHVKELSNNTGFAGDQGMGEEASSGPGGATPEPN